MALADWLAWLAWLAPAKPALMGWPWHWQTLQQDPLTRLTDHQKVSNQALVTRLQKSARMHGIDCHLALKELLLAFLFGLEQSVQLRLVHESEHLLDGTGIRVLCCQLPPTSCAARRLVSNAYLDE